MLMRGGPNMNCWTGGIIQVRASAKYTIGVISSYVINWTSFHCDPICQIRHGLSLATLIVGMWN